MKKIGSIICVLLLALSCSSVASNSSNMLQNPRYMGMVAGYKARLAASAYYYGNRTFEEILEQEFIGMPSVMDEVEVSLTEDGIIALYPPLNIKRRAIFRNNLGVSLLTDNKEAQLEGFSIGQMKTEPDSREWPLGDMNAFEKHSSVDYNKINTAMDYAFGRIKYYKNNNSSPGTRGMLIVHKGKIIYEEYADGFDMFTPQLCMSVSKSVMNGIWGAYVQKTGFDIFSPTTLSEFKGSNKEQITTDSLLRMSSGLDFNESYFDESDDCAHMLYNLNDHAAYAMQKNLVEPVGSKFNYSSGTSNILSALLLHEYQNDLPNYWNFVYKEFFHELGMNNSIFEVNETGMFVGSSFLYSTPRDLARFALLYMNDGKLNQKQFLAPGWVEYSKTPAPGAAEDEYGAQFWLNGNRGFRQLPTNTFFAQGFLGQYIMFFPDKDLVIVRVGNTSPYGNQVSFGAPHIFSTIYNAVN